jgi:hypothetical protein
MDNLAGIGAALAAMWIDDDEPYRGHAMLSALPNAPTIDRPTVRERLLALWAKLRDPLATGLRSGAELPPWPSRTQAAAAATPSPPATASSR